MLLTDKQISKLAENDIFSPYMGSKMRTLPNGLKALSYGLSHAGYDLRLSPDEFFICDPGIEALDVKGFDQSTMYQATLHHDDGNEFFILPPYSYGLGVSLELISMPNNLMGITDGKSTYARQGTIINVTPIEPGWTGHLTICIVNPINCPVRIYANEGIVQVMLAQLASDVDNAYGSGKYQNQGASVTFAAA